MRRSGAALGSAKLHNQEENKMKKLIITLCLAATPAAAQNCTTSFIGNTAYTNCYPSSYDAATNGFNNGLRNAAILQQQRANEAMINLERRRQGLPPCTLAPLRALFTGQPSC
jgi:hypothetical protein